MDSVATLVGLIAQFSESRGARQAAATFEEFQLWIREHGFGDLARAIESNHRTCVSIKACLNEGTEELKVKLSAVEEMLVILTAGLGPLGQLTASASQQVSLSEQAKQILQEFDRTQATSGSFNRRGTDGMTGLILDRGSGGDFVFPEQRFVEDDLRLLVRLGLLNPELTSRGTRVFHISRAGATIGNALRNVAERPVQRGPA